MHLSRPDLASRGFFFRILLTWPGNSSFLNHEKMSDDFEENEKEGHTAAVQALFLQYMPMVRGYILSMLPDFSLAEDVLQETFLVVSKKATDFDLETSFPAWVKTIARFKALELIRKQKSRFVFLSEKTLGLLGTESHVHFNPKEIEPRLEVLAACINELAPQARRTIELRYQKDLLPPQIAEITGCAVASVNVTLSRARAFLRECILLKMKPQTN